MQFLSDILINDPRKLKRLFGTPEHLSFRHIDFFTFLGTGRTKIIRSIKPELEHRPDKMWHCIPTAGASLERARDALRMRHARASRTRLLVTNENSDRRMCSAIEKPIPTQEATYTTRRNTNSTLNTARWSQ